MVCAQRKITGHVQSEELHMQVSQFKWISNTQSPSNDE